MNAVTLVRTQWFALTLTWFSRPAAKPAPRAEAPKKPSRVVRIAGLR